MGVKDHVLAGLARQLSRPEGMRGRFVARGLNRGNRETVQAAVEAAGLRPGDVTADIGFGGGVGLPLLLAGVHPGGHAHAVDISETMLDRARGRHADDILAGSLSVHAGSITSLPLDDTCLDAAITVNTIYFVTDLGRAFEELARVLAPNGRAVVGIGDPTTMAKLPFTAHGFTLRGVDDVVATLERAGLGHVCDIRVGDDEGAHHVLVAHKGSQ